MVDAAPKAPPSAAGESITPVATKAALVATLTVTGLALAAFLGTTPAEAVDPRHAAWFLWLFAGLFLLRVGGQLVVRARQPTWLPPTEEWNLMPYGLLLPFQLAILALMVWMGIDFTRERGLLVESRPVVGRAVLWFSYAYAFAIAVRYAARMARRPRARWFGGAIPIVFHLVLASFLFVFGRFHDSY